MFSKTAINVLFVLFAIASAANPYPEKVKLTDIETLILRDGEMTTGRRSSPVKQLSCSGEYCHARPQQVVCKNIGHDGQDVTWQCTAEDMIQLKFGYDLDVQCEGYEYPDDPYVLVGSCGLSYSLKLKNPSNASPPSYSSNKSKDDESVFAIVPLLVILFLFMNACAAEPTSRSRPYSGYNYSRYDNSPGFWTGAAAGYMAASNRSSSYGSSWGSGRSSWGGSSSSSGFARTSRR